MESHNKAAAWTPLLQQTYALAPPTGRIYPPKALNLCSTLLAQKLDTLNYPLTFCLTTHTQNECRDECVTLECPALLPWAARAALHPREAAEQGGERAVELHYELLGLQVPTQTLNFGNDI